MSAVCFGRAGGIRCLPPSILRPPGSGRALPRCPWWGASIRRGAGPPRPAPRAPLVTTKDVPTGMRWKTWLNLSALDSPSAWGFRVPRWRLVRGVHGPMCSRQRSPEPRCRRRCRCRRCRSARPPPARRHALPLPLRQAPRGGSRRPAAQRALGKAGARGTAGAPAAHLHVPRDKHQDAPRDGGLEVHRAGRDLALVERQRRQLCGDRGGALALVALKREHRLVLVEAGQGGAVAAEEVVVVLQERLRGGGRARARARTPEALPMRGAARRARRVRAPDIRRRRGGTAGLRVADRRFIAATIRRAASRQKAGPCQTSGGPASHRGGWIALPPLKKRPPCRLARDPAPLCAAEGPLSAGLLLITRREGSPCPAGIVGASEIGDHSRAWGKGFRTRSHPPSLALFLGLPSATQPNSRVWPSLYDRRAALPLTTPAARAQQSRVARPAARCVPCGSRPA